VNNDRAAQSAINSITGDGGSEFPGQPTAETTRTNSKGMTAGYTATLSPTLINNFRFGYVRQGLDQAGQQTKHYVHFRGMDDFNAETATINTNVPVFNWVDDLTKERGSHTLQFGANLRQVDNERASNEQSFFMPTPMFTGWRFHAPRTAASALTRGVRLPCGGPVLWRQLRLCGHRSDGLISEVASNYQLTKTLSVIPEGSMVSRHFRAHEIEFYGQDQWRATRNLTLTYGLRYTLLQPPYETDGVQVAPTTSLHDWFNDRSRAMAQGQPYEPLISFALSGQANGKQPYWTWDHKDFAPRFRHRLRTQG